MQNRDFKRRGGRKVAPVNGNKEDGDEGVSSSYFYGKHENLSPKRKEELKKTNN